MFDLCEQIFFPFLYTNIKFMGTDQVAATCNAGYGLVGNACVACAPSSFATQGNNEACLVVQKVVGSAPWKFFSCEDHQLHSINTLAECEQAAQALGWCLPVVYPGGSKSYAKGCHQAYSYSDKRWHTQFTPKGEALCHPIFQTLACTSRRSLWSR